MKDCFKDLKYKESFKPDSLKTNYILKGQRIWRSVNLDNNQNAALLNTSNECIAVGLFEIIKFGLLEKQLNAFTSDDFLQPQLSVLSRTEIISALSYKDSSTVITFDANGNQAEQTSVVKRYILGSDIKSYLLKEDWIINNYTGKTEKYIIAIAPLIYDAKKEMTVPLFWLYYPEWESLFSCFAAKNFYSHEPVSFDDVFKRKYFISQIDKENNVFDRRIKSVNHGQDAYLESELIKEKMRNAESDLFQH